MDFLSPVSSVINGVFGSINTSKSNKAYLKGINDTNAANAALQREQNQWNLEMWNKNNEYNTPAAQRARMIAAGISPSSGISSGSSSAAAMGTEPASMEAPGKLDTPFAPLGQALGGAYSDYLQNRMINEQTKGVQKDNIVKGIKAQFALTHEIQDLKEQISRVYSSDLDNQDKQERLKYLSSTLQHTSRMQQYSEENVLLEQDNLRASAINTQLLNVHQRLMNEAFPQRLSAELRISDAQAFNLVNSISAQYAAIDASIQNTIRSLQSNERINASQVRQANRSLQQQWREFTTQSKIQMRQLGLSTWQANQANRFMWMNLINDANSRISTNLLGAGFLKGLGSLFRSPAPSSSSVPMSQNWY